ncbi:TPA: tetratricopeptide repeat protein [Haemophilus influenzae]|uniref:tetratricopeptide repeat protein n=2 Tax=Haemophilus influenzae TaxID=727 RepID=UPI000039ABAA|nr:tetratricopeptide repeat protein [Haemophilus influenzae]ADO81041.1 Putative TPR repeat protein [Haemophilus influenzae R2866]MCK8949575.1 sel1 repeat family protein [Haemophilus influenzae]MCK8958843.1 sel1 repeat family protein [Haemophilus influenzae]MCK9030106.1 sel1 repeat family protein [Haemophilus influenzae]MCK9053894.1 sel1 repeat family protein [Haemophilus influenzae]
MKLTKTLLTTALLGASVFSFQSTAWADTPEQQFQQGSTAYEQSDYQTAFKLWLPMAEQGDANVQFNLGVMYAKGQGVKQDDFEAVKWFRKAAEQGHAKAQAILGFSYLLGERGVQVNKSLAKEWFGKACDNGNQDGCEYYGKLNRGGF